MESKTDSNQLVILFSSNEIRSKTRFGHKKVKGLKIAKPAKAPFNTVEASLFYASNTSVIKKTSFKNPLYHYVMSWTANGLKNLSILKSWASALNDVFFYMAMTIWGHQ